MTPEQTKHVQDIAEAFRVAVSAKYEHGVKEHGGNLWERSIEYLLDQAIDENIDQFVYLMTLKQKLQKVRLLERVDD